MVTWIAESTKNKSAIKLIQLITISIPDDPNDEEYSRILLKTTINMCRMSQVQTNFFARAIMENFEASSNFEYKFC
jgi:hypothetical protein